MEKDLIRRIMSDEEARRIVLPNSEQVQDLLTELADGKIKVFGIKGESPYTSASRMEIYTDNGRVEVHKNTGGAGGIYGMASRFNGVKVVKETAVSELNIIIDKRTSPTNPIYIFEAKDTGITIGSGYGSEMDLGIADRILGLRVAHCGNYVSSDVTDWIKSKLADN